MFLMPSEIQRFEFAVSWLCDHHISHQHLRREDPQLRAIIDPLSALSMDYIFTYCHFVDYFPQFCWLFADGDGYRSKEPVNVLSVSDSHSFRAAISVWKRRTPHLLCVDVAVLP
jgi:hypothetical protein